MLRRGMVSPHVQPWDARHNVRHAAATFGIVSATCAMGCSEASSTGRPELPQQQWYCQTLHKHGEGNYSKCDSNDCIMLRHLVR
jgi:hypothetical protein